MVTDPAEQTDAEYQQMMVPAFAAVGEFLYHFAALERSMDRAIGQLAGISAKNLDVVCANLALHAKIKILRATSLVHAGASLERPFSKTISEIAELNVTRNIIAHHQFETMKGGIKFYVLRKQTSSSPPPAKFTFVRFEQLYKRIIGCELEVNDFTGALHGQSLGDLLASLSRQPRAKSALAELYGIPLGD